MHLGYKFWKGSVSVGAAVHERPLECSTKAAASQCSRVISGLCFGVN